MAWQHQFFDGPKSPPTREKHTALAKAFAAWRARHATGTVFDGFAGAGRFGDGTYGSPLLLLDAAAQAGGHFDFVFVEKDAHNFARLTAAVGEFLGQPTARRYRASMGSVELVQATFETRAHAITGPVFSFVDPYNYDGVRFTTLRHLATEGDLLVHLGTGALHAKAGSNGGASGRQARRMDGLLGGAVSWAELRRAAAPPERFAEVLAKGLSDVATRVEVASLRDHATHLIWAHLHGRS